MEQERTTTRGLIWEVIKFFLIAALIVVPIRVYVAQPFLVDGPSMEPTFSTGDYLIVDQLSYRFTPPERGDIIILRDPRNQVFFLIKRIIGLPGETITLKDGGVVIKNDVHASGMLLAEPYIEHDKRAEALSEELGDDEYFVMGDNRTASLDSRSFGPVGEELIVGRALVRLFPFAQAAVLPGEHRPER